MKHPLGKAAVLALMVAAAVGPLVVSQYAPFVGSLARPFVVTPPTSRPAWATKLDEPNLPNFYRVTPELYRGAQPAAAGMKRLHELGVRTVVNLRRLHSDRDEIGSLGLGYEHIDVDPFKPKEAELVAFLRVATDPNRTPVFVHCQRGIDRTGLMVAVYRIVVCGWTQTQAIDEMTNGPYGYDAIFANVPAFLATVDIDKLRRKVEAGR